MLVACGHHNAVMNSPQWGSQKDSILPRLSVSAHGKASKRMLATIYTSAARVRPISTAPNAIP